jgi:Tfp pilus assembly protein PilX
MIAPRPASFPPRARRAPRGWPAAGSRGTILIVALLLMAVIALGITSYMNLSLGSARLAHRGFQQTAAFNLAEAGAEEALWSLNRANAHQSDAWTGWTIVGSTAKNTFANFDFGANSTGSIRVLIDNYSQSGATNPTIIAKSTVQAVGQPPVSKMIELALRRRSRFTASLMAKQNVTFSGLHTSVDSWNSDPDNDPATAPVDYSAAVRNDQGSVASVAVDNTAVLVNQADIYGYAYTGGGTPQVGTQGSITGRNTPLGVQVDPTRVATDFSADFPAVTVPVDGTVLTTIGSTLGTAGQATKWRCNSLSLNGSQTLTIYGDVTLVLTAGSGTHAIDVTGNASIIISEHSSLTVYVEGDVLIAGNGLANNNVRPATATFYGTNASAGGQSFHIAGNGALRAVAYAPNANLKVNGNGDVMGAFIANNISVTGNADFHYDESLANATSDMPFGVQSWREITNAADIASRDARLP